MSGYNPDTDPQSSNSLIRAYLASKGVPLNGENVRRALEANNANAGTIPGLVNSLPSTEAEDQAAMAAARGRGGAAGSGIGATRGTTASPNQVAGQDTSAAPGAESGGSGDDSQFPWLAAAAGGAGAALAPILSRLRGGGSQTRVPATATEPGMDLGDIRLSLNRPELAGPVDVGGAQVNLGRQAQPRLLPNAAQPSIGSSVLAGEPLSIGAPAPQLAAPQSADGRPVANPNEPIPMRGPGPPDVIPLPGQRVQPIQTPDQFIANNPITGNVPAIEVAPSGTRAPRRARAARVRVP